MSYTAKSSTIITSTPITTATVGVLYTYDVNATDPNEDILTYSLITKPSGMTINSITGLIGWTPTSIQIGSNLVTVNVSDEALDVIQSFTIVVSEPSLVNQAPIIYSTPITIAIVGIAYIYNVTATDPDNDTLTYSLTTYPNGMTINPVNGLIWWIPTSAQVGSNSITVIVSDGALSDTQSFAITVSTSPTPPPVNSAPNITSIPNLNATVGVLYVYEVKATDPDGDTLTYSILTAKPGDMDINSSTGKITWTPTAKGNYDVTVKVSDGKLSDTQNFTITVPNRAPIIATIDNQVVLINDDTFTYPVSATDPDGDDLTYSLPIFPSGMTITPTIGLISWDTPDSAVVVGVEVKVSDGDLDDTQYFTITVELP